MPLCLFRVTGNLDGREKACARPGCKNKVITDDPPERCFAQCESATIHCIHLGDKTRRETCQSCGGNVQIKIFRCALYGECTLGVKLVELACCQSCESFTAPSSSAVVE